MDVIISDFGRINETQVSIVSIKNDNGSHIQITNFGGIVHSWLCHDNRGDLGDILLGCQNLSEYQNGHPYFGAIIGRYANRINLGQFDLNGTKYQVPLNLPPHHLHGGFYGFDKKVWSMDVKQYDNNCLVSLKTESHHLEEGFPGNLMVNVDYTFTSDNQLIIEYYATTDQITVINLTNHCYFNLSGNKGNDILDHEVLINADFYTENNESSIPTGALKRVEGTIMDFNSFRNLGAGILSGDPLLHHTKGYDHNFVLKNPNLNIASAVASHPVSGRVLEVYTDQPGIQLYTGNFLNGIAGKIGTYQDFAGFCLETQHFPDSPNHKHFPETTLRPGQQFYSKTIYKISTNSL